jgi:hypothetical protein
MVAALIPNLQMCRELSMHALGNAMCWFKRLGDTPEMRQLASVLTPKVLACRGKIDLNAFGNTLHELLGFGHSKEVRDFLIALDPMMELYFLDLPGYFPRYITQATHEC